ncbi:MAG: tetratricopeptide repeat protein [Nitrospirae bacterium]|nr:tetratricopeptide repeat protein [Nitrospirota bacterium]MBI5695233.1 tetratricopeptide repeat protein [Nitrospirota bacterium]
MTTIPDTKKARLICAAAVLLACSAAYYNTLACGFVADDHELLAGNPWVRDFSHIREIFTSGIWAEHGKQLNYYRPVVHAIYLLGYQTLGPEPWGFHLMNMFFQAGVSLLVFALSHRLAGMHGGGGSALLPALAAGLVFAVHPIHTESVAWISGITDVSCALFCLLSLYLYLAYRSGSGRAWLAASAVAFLLAALCKEAALTLPLVILAYDLLFPGTRPAWSRSAAYAYAPFAAAALAYLAMRSHSLGGFAPESVHDKLGPSMYVINAAALFGGYVTKVILPVNLYAYYVFYPARSALDPAALPDIAAAAASAFALYLARRDRLALFGAALFVLPLLPVMYIYGLGDSVFAERYLYLPSAGIAFLAGLVFGRLAERPGMFRASAALLFAAVLSFGLLTAERNRAWASDETLWMAALDTAEHTGRPSYDFALILSKLGRMEDALVRFEDAVREMPGYVKARNNLAAAYSANGMFDKAVEQDRAAIALRPGQFKYYYNLGMDLQSLGRLDEAEAAFREALGIRADFSYAHYGLGLVYLRKGLADEAAAELSLAVRYNPGDAEARALLEQAEKMKAGGGK